MKKITKNTLIKEGFMYVVFHDGRQRYRCKCDGEILHLTFEEACDVLRKEEPEKYGAAA